MGMTVHCHRVELKIAIFSKIFTESPEFIMGTKRGRDKTPTLPSGELSGRRSRSRQADGRQVCQVSENAGARLLTETRNPNQW